MKHVIILLSLFLTYSQVISQNVITTRPSTIQPIDYSRVGAAVQYLNNRFDNAKAEYWEVYNKAVSELYKSNPNYSICVSYLNQCLLINQSLNNLVADNDIDIYEKLATCYHAINNKDSEVNALLSACALSDYKKPYAERIMNIQYNEQAAYILLQDAFAYNDFTKIYELSDMIIAHGSYNKELISSVYYIKGCSKENQYSFDEALDCYNKSLSIDQNDVNVLYARSRCYCQKGQFFDAKIDLDRLVLIFEDLKKKNDVDASLGLVYYARYLVNTSLGEKEQAKKDLKKAAKYGNIDAKVKLNK